MGGKLGLLLHHGVPPLFLPKSSAGIELKKKINSKLKHIKCGIERKEAFLSLFLKQDKNICLERLPCSQELCLGHLYVSRALHRVGVQEMLAQ